MKIDELMIGDWVQVNGTPMQIQAIDDIDGEIMAGDELYCLIEDKVHSEDKIEPIPLTAEVLEKNNFRLIGVVWHYRGYTYDVCVEFTDKIAVRIYNELRPKDEKGRQDMVSYNRDWAQPFYVHELQRALRLCGIDKTIETI